MSQTNGKYFMYIISFNPIKQVLFFPIYTWENRPKEIEVLAQVTQVKVQVYLT